MLNWKKKCRNEQTIASDRKIWETLCEKYRVTLSHIRYGGGVLPDRYYAEEKTDRCWELISKHRKKETAMIACEKRDKEKQNDIAKLQRMAKKTKRRKKCRTRKN
jgi:hypothetical protein